jgi:hypothetical protein
MQRDRVTGLVNMGVIQYLYLPIQNVPPQFPSFPLCGSAYFAQILTLWLGCFSIFFLSSVFSAHSGLLYLVAGRNKPIRREIIPNKCHKKW